MKRTIQGLLVTSLVLIAGCANSPEQPVPVKADPVEQRIAVEEVMEARDNLAGICKAIVHYGLVPDRQIRQHVKEKVAGLNRIARTASGVSPSIRRRVRGVVRELSARYRRCDPSLAVEIRFAPG